MFSTKAGRGKQAIEAIKIQADTENKYVRNCSYKKQPGKEEMSGCPLRISDADTNSNEKKPLSKPNTVNRQHGLQRATHIPSLPVI